MNSAPLFFFDSHGGLWATTDADADGAAAFGPTGIARAVSDDEAAALGLELYEPRGDDCIQNEDGSWSVGWYPRTAFAAASASGRVDEGEEGDFPVLTFPAGGTSIHGASVDISE